ncbi:hypothetical protein ACTXT7_015356 [Hymenolepis weldensis]
MLSTATPVEAANDGMKNCTNQSEMRLALADDGGKKRKEIGLAKPIPHFKKTTYPRNLPSNPGRLEQTFLFNNPVKRDNLLSCRLNSDVPKLDSDVILQGESGEA